MFQLEQIGTAREQRPRLAELQNLTDGGMGSSFKNKSAPKVPINTWEVKCTKSKTLFVFCIVRIRALTMIKFILHEQMWTLADKETDHAYAPAVFPHTGLSFNNTTHAWWGHNFVVPFCLSPLLCSKSTSNSNYNTA